MLADARALSAVLVLLLLPGFTIVRAPWTAVPFLSLGYWIVSWWWLSSEGGGREAFLRASLFVFACLGLLRLVRARPSLPAWPDLLVGAYAATRLLPFFAWPLPPGASAPFHGLVTRLLVWHDSVPRTFEPLLAVPVFAAGDAALATFAADLGLLAGVPPHRALLAVLLAAEALLPLALYGALRRFVLPQSAAVGTCLGLGLVPLALALRPWDDPAVLALGFAVSALGLLLRGETRSTAVAAGLFVSAGLLAEPLLVAALIVPVLVAASAWHRPPARLTRERLGIAAAVAALGAVPPWVRAPSAVSAGEWSSRLDARTATSLGASVIAVVAVATVIVAVDRLLARRGPAAGRLLCALGLVAVGVTTWEWQTRRASIAWTPEDEAAAAALAGRTGPLDVVCRGAEPAGPWLPAVAGRATFPPDVPFVLRDEAAAGARRPCAETWGSASR
jgi:hypothetical protein